MSKVKIVWDNGRHSKELGPGDYKASQGNHHGDFPNDVIEEIHVPFGMMVGASVHFTYDEKGKVTMFNGENLSGDTIYKLKNYKGLYREISALRVSSFSEGIL